MLVLVQYLLIRTINLACAVKAFDKPLNPVVKFPVDRLDFKSLFAKVVVISALYYLKDIAFLLSFCELVRCFHSKEKAF